MTLTLDDGSGPLMVTIRPAARVDVTPLTSGTWIAVRGVLGQETTKALADRGYRVWPREGTDVEVLTAQPLVAAPRSASRSAGGPPAGSDLGSAAPALAHPSAASPVVDGGTVPGLRGAPHTPSAPPAAAAAAVEETASPRPMAGVLLLGGGLFGVAGLLVLGRRVGTLSRLVGIMRSRVASTGDTADESTEQQEPSALGSPEGIDGDPPRLSVLRVPGEAGGR